MKKALGTLSLFLLLTSGINTHLLANQVSVQTAKTVAVNFFKANATNINNQTSITATLNYTRKEADNTIDFYVFDISPKGFIIVSGDDNVTPVIGYSTETNFYGEAQHAGVTDWMNHAATHIHTAIQQYTQADSHIAALWSSSLQPSESAGTLKSMKTAVAPLLSTQWGQEPYYNQLCPYNNVDQHRAVTGCVATAMAQIMKYWNYPAKGTGSYAYLDAPPAYSNNFGSQSANFGATTYNWAAMAFTLDSNNTSMSIATDTANIAVATLMYHCGVAVAMDYGDAAQGGSGAYVLQSDATSWQHSAEFAYKTYFSYNPKTLHGVRQSDYTSADWVNLLKSELNAGRPIQYEGQEPGVAGHTWVCDGYDANDMFHMNWGWNGQDNGYFSLSNLSGSRGDFSSNEEALIGIEPIVNLSVQAAVANSLICPGDTTQLSTAASESSVYSWSPAAGLDCSNCAITAAHPVTTTTYTLTRDSSGFTATSSVIISVRPGINITNSPVTHVSCYGGNNGSVGITATGGVSSSFLYKWNNGQSTPLISNLFAGTYFVTITDGSGCSASASKTVSQPDALFVSISATNAGCNKVYGEAVANVTGGTEYFSYLWNTGETTPAISNIAAGNYELTVTDGHSCTASSSVTITQRNPIQLSLASGSATQGLEDGFASVKNIDGAIAPYTFSWSNGDSSQSISKLAPGTYAVTVADKEGCQQTATALVSVATLSGIDNISEDVSFNVYPNPAANAVSVRLNKLDNETILVLKNVLGETLLQQAVSDLQNDINVSSFANGVYFMMVKHGNQSSVKELVVKR